MQFTDKVELLEELTNDFNLVKSYLLARVFFNFIQAIKDFLKRIKIIFDIGLVKESEIKQYNSNSSSSSTSVYSNSRINSRDFISLYMILKKKLGDEILIDTHSFEDFSKIKLDFEISIEELHCSREKIVNLSQYYNNFQNKVTNVMIEVKNEIGEQPTSDVILDKLAL